MKRLTLGTKGKQWLKSSHLILSVIWLGAAICMNLLRFGWTPTGNNDLYAVDHSIVIIDHWVIIPASFGALLTGFLASWLTTWGFCKYRWVTVKWIVTVAMMLYAPIFQAQWAREIEAISKAAGLMALQDPTYLQYRMLYTLSGMSMITALAFLSIISTLKPWMKKDMANIKQRLTRSPGRSI